MKKKLIDQLFINAEKAVCVFNNLEEKLNKLEFDIPKSYNPNLKGGFMIAGFNLDNLNFKQVGRIMHIEDNEFGTKSEKDKRYVFGKYHSMIKNNVSLSELAEFKIHVKNKSSEKLIKVAGGIAFPVANGKKLFMAFSGLNNEEDQAIIVLSAHKTKTINDNYVCALYNVTKNPYLKKEFFDILYNEM